jgi:hypothetical protein
MSFFVTWRFARGCAIPHREDPNGMREGLSMEVMRDG